MLAESTAGVDAAVAIPALAEHDSLFQTLDSLNANPPAQLERTLVICVVNNRASGDAPHEAVEENRATLAALNDARMKGAYGFRLGCIDACTPGNELPPKEGVGLARKLGMDAAAAVLAQNDAPGGVILALDADTTVEPNYLPAVREAFAKSGAWASAIEYAHGLDGPSEVVAAIVQYELFLRYYVLGLRYAGSPYAFHSVGSAMACTADAYAAVAGMNRRTGAEDFYFLQQLAKTGRMDVIHDTVVHPSPRPSWRVPFGTGRSVARHLENGADPCPFYDAQCFDVLREWLSLMASPPADADSALTDAESISPPLASFLSAQGFEAVWPRLMANAASADQLRRQFHGWFDGFKTLKLVHCLRENGFPNQPLWPALQALLKKTGHPVPELESPAVQTDIGLQVAVLKGVRAL